MIDKSLYVAASGSRSIFDRMARSSNNLANANTDGFRSEFLATRAVYSQGQSSETRAYAVEIAPGANFQPGSIQQTGSSLDLAVNGKGWVVVKAANGEEAMTRGGHLRINPNGDLETAGGLKIVGDAGILNVGELKFIAIAEDGTVTGRQANGKPSIAGKIKLANPDEKTITRGDDGLFRTKNGTIEGSDDVRVVNGAVEGSNVNVMEEMTRMIELSRQFDLNIKVMQAADANSKQASEIIKLG